MHFPLWFVLLFLPVLFWPVFLAMTALATVVAVRVQGQARAVASIAAVLLAVGPVIAAYMAVMAGLENRRIQKEYAATHAVLAAETTLDGLRLPAGTEVTWLDPPRTRLADAALPGPTEVLGLPATAISRDGDGWMLSLAEPRTLDGWPCDGFSVSVTRDGRLRSCLLSEATEWRGWALPPLTAVSPRPDGRLGLRLRDGADLAYPGLDQPLPEEVVANADGSLHAADFLRASLTVWSVRLVRVVEWRCAPGSEGRGRGRPAVALVGTTYLPTTTPNSSWEDLVGVAVRLSDGMVTREPDGGNGGAAASGNLP